MFSIIIMSVILQKSPIISLSPTVIATKDNLVSLIPVSTRIYTEPDVIFYDPFKTFEVVVPNYAYYFSYPDLNTDVSVQRKVLEDVWYHLENEWIYGYLKVFNYIKKSGSSYKLIDSLREIEKKVSSGDMEDKAEWLLHSYYRKSDLGGTIEKFRKRSNLNWWEVNNKDNINILKEFIYNQIRRKMINDIS